MEAVGKKFNEILMFARVVSVCDCRDDSSPQKKLFSKYFGSFKILREWKRFFVFRDVLVFVDVFLRCCTDTNWMERLIMILSFITRLFVLVIDRVISLEFLYLGIHVRTTFSPLLSMVLSSLILHG